MRRNSLVRGIGIRRDARCDNADTAGIFTSEENRTRYESMADRKRHAAFCPAMPTISQDVVLITGGSGQGSSSSAQ